MTGLQPDQLAREVFAYALVFARVGGAFVALPGIGEPFVSPRLRLLMALAFTACLTPALMPSAGPVPADAVVKLLAELVWGLLLGGIGRIALAACHLAGGIVSMQSGLSTAAMFDPSAATQGTIPGTFLTLAALTLFFAGDGHLAMLAALADGYAHAAPGAVDLAPGDMAASVTQAVGAATATALRMAAPVIAVGLVLQLALGAVNRLMPAFQVMLVSMPLQILLALAVFAMSLGACLALATGLLATMVAPGPGGG